MIIQKDCENRIEATKSDCLLLKNNMQIIWQKNAKMH